MAYKDLGNNIQFDPETGQIQIVDASGATQYQYDPRHGDKGGTLLGNQWYEGELNPQVLSAITPEGYQKAIDKYATVGDLGINTEDPKMNNAFGNNLGEYSQEQQNYMNQWGSIATNKSTMDAYNEQQKQMGDLGDPFSAAIKDLASQKGVMSDREQTNAGINSQIQQGNQTAEQYKTSHPGVSDDVAAVMSNPNMSDAVKQAVLGKNYVGTPAAAATSFNPYDTGKGQTFDYSLGRYQNNTAPKSAAQVGYVPGPDTVKQPPVPQPVQTSAVSPVVAPVQTQAVASDTSAAEPAAQPDYTGFFNAIYTQLQPYMTGTQTPSSTPDTSTGLSNHTSASFDLGGTSAKEPTISSNNASPDFSSGGYNPQTNYQDTQLSGKGSPASTSQSSGMSTGQFGSK